MYRQSVDGALSIFTSPPFFHKYRAMFVHAHLYLATNGYSGARRSDSIYILWLNL